MSANTTEASSSEQSHLIVVSNRLPVTLTRGEDNMWSAKLSSGGLVAALSGLKKETSFRWVGWPGGDFSADDRVKIDSLLGENSCSAVYLDDETAELYYNGFSNSILWPLFHYHPGEINFEEADWEALPDSLLEVVQDGDLVWIHDYHLMLLPRMLRTMLDGRGLKSVKIGWFLHTPFPSSELYRILPGVLSADLLGFHTYDYARHFLSSCARILGLHTSPDVHVGTFPIGIDPDKFSEALETDAVKARLGHFEQQFRDTQVVVGVDRLDYIKGVPQKLLAFEELLARHPEYVGRVVLVQVAVPSRGDVEEYQQLIVSVSELVGRINGRFGTVEYTPIHFLHKSVDFTELVSLYAISEVCLITSTRDGMNLVSYEYVASQQKRHGVLVLSEFAGAAQSLNGSIIINSWNIEEALSMSADQRLANFTTLYRYSSTNSRPAPKARVVVLDYDGTLSATKSIPEFARPSPLTLNILRRLAALPHTLVYVVSGRIRAHMARWFQGIDIGLVAEHGLFYRHPSAAGAVSGESSPHYTERTPGSFIEEKEIDVTWHYRNTDPEFGSMARQTSCR
ncbi:hypothetical protein DL89DRAFT_275303 [Linderina pennispora]|uniref:alpha,alpha-trehalose-phosphate synthase (UDP-forming) n=1 Tax=Linderina pennispora TaxID=61395 RepID=A0A1Y1W5L2_9FUNG|nr:uncharacterized protein DL89DRAFT_275303 [Linderina pennispora]ORX68830.1 hypothetical protein DL89DRAFT_275303 [Linderina pennispora]